jgi:hypothetical protein
MYPLEFGNAEERERLGRGRYLPCSGLLRLLALRTFRTLTEAWCDSCGLGGSPDGGRTGHPLKDQIVSNAMLVLLRA